LENFQPHSPGFLEGFQGICRAKNPWDFHEIALRKARYRKHRDTGIAYDHVHASQFPPSLAVGLIPGRGGRCLCFLRPVPAAGTHPIEHRLLGTGVHRAKARMGSEGRLTRHLSRPPVADQTKRASQPAPNPPRARF
jgi:hypothetical protein